MTTRCATTRPSLTSPSRSLRWAAVTLPARQLGTNVLFLAGGPLRASSPLTDAGGRIGLVPLCGKDGSVGPFRTSGSETILWTSRKRLFDPKFERTTHDYAYDGR